ncbi:nuclear pore complex protein [Holotrichia oblita]|uniref:Nuclear pore complex protein n=1 Tax=Holotrichia oblita TaxID=644536 RepID=A0ACB9TRQ9_HOLOL|nr:nuclear pore complex protein [Holotrichia oblita]
MTEGNNTSEDLWNPYKELLRIVTSYLTNQAEHKSFSQFENILKKHKQNFFSLLQNPPKNAKSREELKKGMEDGINIRGRGAQTLSKELYQETIILSDMYDLNEFAALDLLCTAQMQIPFYPGLPRGLIAVLLYYDGRKCLLSALRSLVQCRKGIAWTLKVSSETERFVTAYTDQLMENGVGNASAKRCVRGSRHQKQVVELFNSIRLLLSDIVFLWSTHCGLPKQSTINLISYLKELKLEEESTGTLDNVNLYLLGALLSAIDLSILHTREDAEEVVQSLPILSEFGFVEGVANELLPEKDAWATDGLHAVAMYAFSIFLSSLRSLSQSQNLHDVLERESQFIDMAIEKKVFRFLYNIVLENQLIYTEEILYKKMHHLLTDFIVQMFSKVKEMRIKADESARTMQANAQHGIEAPNNLPKHFEDFLYYISKFYERDPLNLHLMLDYWCSFDNSSKENIRVPTKSVSLFKFVKLAGDMIPATLFVPYLNMLASLSNCQQAARYCFNMLKQASPGCNNTLTWEHFFMSFSQYYTNLRQEMPPINDTVYRQRTIYHKGITPQEVQGLHAVLKLIRVIAVNDDFSRLALCEHPGWAPLTVLLGLVSCSVPIPLKSDILLTLAALSKSPETANQMWNNLETSQILVTIPSTSSYQPRGIQTELDEIETRLETYPLTRGLLKLLDTLTDSGIPRTLGAGPRIPGFDPYFTFIVNSVFLKCNSRPYKNPDEKWEITGMCLKLFEKFIQHYNPEMSDFQNAVAPNQFNSPPGYHVMVQLNTKSDVLNLILAIVNEGINIFDSYKPISGQKYIEECILSCLNIMERCLALQAKFYNLLSSSPCSVPMTSFSKLLLSVNPRTNNPDYVMNVAKFTGHQLILPQHCLVAVKILLELTNSAVVHAQLMNILLAHGDNKSLRYGFFECLDCSPEFEDDVVTSTKEAILTLIKQCLPYKAPNFSHYLLGFDLTKEISATIFQSPGVLESPRTCIHSLFGIMNAGINSSFKMKPSLLELAYQTLYLLCSNSTTSEPTLKLLRMIPNFFESHISDRFKHANDGIHELNQLSWLLMTVAIELKVSCRMKQIHYVRQLTQLLIDLPYVDNSKLNPYSLVPAKNNLGEIITVYGSTEEKPKGISLLTKLITMFDFSIKEVATPHWDFFDNNVLNNLLNNCQTESSPKLVDIKKLHQILINELSAIQGTAAIGQRHAIMQEIEKVLVHALNINNTRQTAASMVRFVDSWRQVVQVLIIYMPYTILTAYEQQNFQLSLLEQLLKKIVKVVLLPDIGNLLSGAVLLLLENLRKSYMYSEKQKKIEHADASPNERYPNVIESNPTVLKSILNNLTDWILVADVTAQKLRVNLYGSLVTFLHLISVEHNTDIIIEDSSFVNRLDSSRLRIRAETYTVQLSSDTFSIFGEKFIEILCHDCIGGQEVCKMLAMASFSLLISLCGNINWIVYMSGRGYLKHLIQSVLDGDNELRMILEPIPENIRSLYVYEAKMALLSRLATTRVGSELLLEQHLLSCLSNMRVFDYHPEISKLWEDYEDGENFVPPIEYRYLQIWLPCLYVCNAILTSLGTENQSAVVQVMHFLFSHLDAVELILRSGSPFLCAPALKELSVLTGVVGRTANNDLVSILENFTVPQDNRAHLYRIQKLMLALLGKFILTDSNIRDLLCDPAMNGNVTYQTSERLLHTLQIVSNLMLYARNLVANHSIDHSCVGVIFQPTLSDSLNNFNGKHYKNFNEHSPSLGVIIQHLVLTVQHFHKEKVTLNFLQNKLKEIPRMDTTNLKEFVTTPDDAYNIGVIRENAYELTSEKLKNKRKEIGYCSFIIEHALYLIWAHLDYYMLRAISKAKNYGLSNANTTINVDSTLVSASEAMWKVSTDDISNLKQGLVSIFTDSFSSQLLGTTEVSIYASIIKS